MLKKIIRTAADVLSVIVIVLAVCVLLAVIFTKKGNAPKIMGYSAFRVLTGSMEPNIRTDSMVVVRETDAENLEKGDVIAFYSSDPEIYGKVNTHRIAEVGEDEFGSYFITKGDANFKADEDPVRPEHVVGKVVGVSYFWGKAVAFIANPIVFAICVIVPLLFMVVTNLMDAAKMAKQIEREELEEALKKQKEADTQTEDKKQEE